MPDRVVVGEVPGGAQDCVGSREGDHRLLCASETLLPYHVRNMETLVKICLRCP